MASRKIGALWLKKSKDGSKTFLSGVLQDLRGDINIVVFKNDRKEQDNHPDYNIVLQEERKETQQAAADDFLAGGESAAPGPESAQEDEIKVENIPF